MNDLMTPQRKGIARGPYGWVFVALWLPAGLVPAHAQEATPPEPPPERVRERNLLFWEAYRYYWKAGRTADAAASIRRMLVVERDAFRDYPLDLAGALDFAAYVFWNDGDLDAARAAEREALVLREKHAGKDFWVTVDTRYKLERIERLCKLDVTQRRQYREFLILFSAVRDPWSKEDAVTRERKKDEALEMPRQVVGETHPEYATALHDLLGILQDLQRKLHPNPWRDEVSPIMRKIVDVRRQALGEMHPDYAESLAMVAKDAATLRRAAAIRKRTLGEWHPDYADSLRRLAQFLRRSAQEDRNYGRVPPDLRKGSRRGEPTQETDREAEAESCYLQALAIYRKAYDPSDSQPMQAWVLNALAQIAWHRGELDRAESYLRQRQALMDARSDPRERQAHFQQWSKPGRNHPALNWQLTLGQPPEDQENWNLIKTKYIMMGYGRSMTLQNLGYIALRKGDYGQAAEHFREGVDSMAEGLMFLGPVGGESIRQVHGRHGHDECLGCYLSYSLNPRSGISAAEAYGRVLAIKGAFLLSQRLVRAERGRPELKPLYTELQTLSSDLARVALSPPPPDDRPAWDRIARQADRKKILETNLAERIYVQQRQPQPRPAVDRVQASLPADGALVDFVQVVTVFRPWLLGGVANVRTGDVRLQNTRMVPEDTRIVAFVMRPGKEVVRLDLGPLQPIADGIDEWLRQVRDGVGSPATGARLRQLIWDPLEPHLGGVHNVLVCPDGPLCRFPLAALPGRRPGTFLLEDCAVGTLPIPQALALEHRDARAGTDLLLMGDIDYGADPGKAPLFAARGQPQARPTARPAVKFRPLVGTAGEAKAVNELFTEAHPGGTVQLLRGAAATEEAFRQSAPHRRYVHLATHGFWLQAPAVPAAQGQEEANATLSGLVAASPGTLTGLALAGANRPAQVGRDDGILSAAEVQELDLRPTELVVLSACETALGQPVPGEGLLGLQRAFQVAGARALVASLWKVDDAATAVLMEEFYTNLCKRKLPKLEALRQAQRTVLREPERVLRRQKDLREELAKRGQERGLDLESPLPAGAGRPRRSPPLWWAAFVLSGDGR
jgi:CHAT domain-containing protein/tetratricopeptide (TPR) repeat protein